MSQTVSWLEIKLAVRMLIKYPGLTVIATIAVAFAIAVGTVGFEIARQTLWPTIPLPDGNAIVALQNWNVADNARAPASRRDYELWRDGLSTITDLSAIEVEERSIAVGTGPRSAGDSRQCDRVDLCADAGSGVDGTHIAGSR